MFQLDERDEDILLDIPLDVASDRSYPLSKTMYNKPGRAPGDKFQTRSVM